MQLLPVIEWSIIVGRCNTPVLAALLQLTTRQHRSVAADNYTASAANASGTGPGRSDGGGGGSGSGDGGDESAERMVVVAPHGLDNENGNGNVRNDVIKGYLGADKDPGS